MTTEEIRKQITELRHEGYGEVFVCDDPQIRIIHHTNMLTDLCIKLLKVKWK